MAFYGRLPQVSLQFPGRLDQLDLRAPWEHGLALLQRELVQQELQCGLFLYPRDDAASLSAVKAHDVLEPLVLAAAARERRSAPA
jgi:hypothetical protein